MELKDFPFIRCLEPKRVFNPYLNDWLLVPCGKCRACQCSKASRYKLQIQLEASQHKFCIFGTLTYANTYIPRLSLVPYNDKTFGVVNGYEMCDKETGEYLGYLDSPSYDVESLLDKLHLFGDVPYLRKRDLQLFIKRLRKNLSKYSDAKVRYFAMGEYGPVHFRPHYHFLLFFDEIKFTAPSGHTLGEFPDWAWYDSQNKCSRSDILSVVEYCIRSSWKFGRVDAQYSKGDAAQYVSSYVSGSGSLPKVYQVSSARPFSLHSRFLGQGFLAHECEKVYETPVRDFVKRSVELNGSNKDFNLWRSCYSVFYPKCKGFTRKSSSERLYTYKLYDTAKRLFPYVSSVIELARETMIHLTFYVYGKQHTVAELDYDIKRYLLYFRDSLNINEVVLQYGFDDVRIDKCIYLIYNELLLSRHFLEFCCSGRSQNFVFKRIEAFYKDLDYLQLTEFFKSQELYFSQDFCDSDDYVYMYNNSSFSLDAYKQSMSYLSFEQQTFEIWRSKIKHKELNDLNQLFFDK
nr:unnamed protein product [uncultured bacterium]